MWIHVFYAFFYSEINSVYYFYWKMTFSHSHKFVGDFWLLLTIFFIFITTSISLSYKAKINLAVPFRHKNPENQYMSHKKYGVHLGFSGPFDLVCLQYSSSVRASSPTTRTANSTLGLKRPTLRPRYTIYYFFSIFFYIFKYHCQNYHFCIR